MNKDAQGRRKVERSESNWKCGLKRMEASCFSVSTTFLRVLQSDTVSELVMLRDRQPYLTGRLEVTDGGMIFGFDFLLG